jgi:hypothetical protein
MAYTWDKANANAPTRRTTQYFEMLGNRAIFHDGWVAATTPATLPWELSTGCAAARRDHRLQVGALQRDAGSHAEQGPRGEDAGQAQADAEQLFYLEAAKYDVLPLDNTTLARWNAPKPKPDGRAHGVHVLGPLASGTPNSGAPSILNKSYTITAEVTIPAGRRRRDDRHRRWALRRLRPVPEQGRAAAFGRGKPVFSTTCSTSSARSGRARARARQAHHRLRLQVDGPASARAAPGVLYVDGKEVARELDGAHGTPITFPEDETFDVGQDTRTGVALLEYRYDGAVQVHRHDRQADFQSRTGTQGGSQASA